jgi:hypothetical protein
MSVDEFVTKMKQQYPNVKKSKLTRARRLYEISQKPRRLIYVLWSKGRLGNREYSFWSPAVNSIDKLVNSPTIVVLLSERIDCGYAMSPYDVQRLAHSTQRGLYYLKSSDLENIPQVQRFDTWLELMEIIGLEVVQEQSNTATDLDLDDLDVRRKMSEINRIIRDTALSRKVKSLYHHRCQICGETVLLYDEKPYAEAHHIKPLGSPHNGPDIQSNILCICPNHHAQLDYGAIKIELHELQIRPGHEIQREFIEYHNDNIYGLRYLNH